MAGKKEAKAGTEGPPHDQRSGIGRVKAESSLETTGSLAPVYREEGIQDWEGLSKSERDLDFVNETMRTDQIHEYHHEDRDGGAGSHLHPLFLDAFYNLHTILTRIVSQFRFCSKSKFNHCSLIGIVFKVRNQNPFS